MSQHTSPLMPKKVEHPKPMRAAPGGGLTPDETVGRAELSEQLWKRLDDVNLIIESERRLGKTLLVKLMIARAPEDASCIFMEISGLSTPADFVNELLQALERDILKPKKKSLRNWFEKAVRSLLPGLEISGILRIPVVAEKHWRSLLKDTIEAVLELIDERVVLFWDEMPWMLQNIMHREGEGMEAVTQLLGSLRDMRQIHDKRLRMVFVGSIGFHHILGGPVSRHPSRGHLNDMQCVEVLPLAMPGTIELVHRLAAGEGVVTRDIEALGREIHEATGGFAYYIHHIIPGLARLEEATPETVYRVVDGFMRSPNDLWQMRHYRERLECYNKSSHQWEHAAIALLSRVGAAEDSVPFAELLAVVSQDEITAHGPLNKTDLLRLLELIMQDHYLEEPTDFPRTYRFRFPLVKRWWRFDQGLDL